MDLDEARELLARLRRRGGPDVAEAAHVVLARLDELEQLRRAESRVQHCRHYWPGFSADEMCECGAQRRPRPN